MATNDLVELTVNLTEEDIARVTLMAAQQHATKTQILREAIQYKEFVDRKVAEGAELLLRWNDRDERTVIRGD